MTGIELDNELEDKQYQTIVFSIDGNVQEIYFSPPIRYTPTKRAFRCT